MLFINKNVYFHSYKGFFVASSKRSKFKQKGNKVKLQALATVNVVMPSLLMKSLLKHQRLKWAWKM